MDTKLIVSASPHLRSEETTAGLMANVIVALTPCVVASAIIFGLRALLVTAVSVVACVAFEWLYCKLMKKANPISDLSAVVTGIILDVIAKNDRKTFIVDANRFAYAKRHWPHPLPPRDAAPYRNNQ